MHALTRNAYFEYHITGYVQIANTMQTSYEQLHVLLYVQTNVPKNTLITSIKIIGQHAASRLIANIVYIVVICRIVHKKGHP